MEREPWTYTFHAPLSPALTPSLRKNLNLNFIRKTMQNSKWMFLRRWVTKFTILAPLLSFLHSNHTGRVKPLQEPDGVSENRSQPDAEKATLCWELEPWPQISASSRTSREKVHLTQGHMCPQEWRERGALHYPESNPLGESAFSMSVRGNHSRNTSFPCYLNCSRA